MIIHPKVILGLNISHEPSAVLNIDGNIIAACEEEKLISKKGHHGFPFKALNYVFSEIPERQNLTNFEVAFGCENIREFLPSPRAIMQFFGGGVLRPRDILTHLSFFLSPANRKEIQLKKVLEDTTSIYLNNLNIRLNSPIKFNYVEHHLAHALSASLFRKDQDYCVLTADGKGDGKSATFTHVQNGNLQLIASLSQFQSLGQIYSACTVALGFRKNRHEGKITGLSALGESDIFYFFLLKICGPVQDFLKGSSAIYKENLWAKFPIGAYLIGNFRFTKTGVKNFLKFSSLPKNEKIFFLGSQHYVKAFKQFISMSKIPREDVARGVQKYISEILVNFLSSNLVNVNVNKLGLAGGLFANVRLNQEILNLDGISDIFVQPAMHDAGTALGATLKYAPLSDIFDLTNLSGTVYLGTKYELEDYSDSLKMHNLKLSEQQVDSGWVAKQITEGKIIGIFAGKIEWGPRALGNRSILASSVDRDIPNKLNQKLNRSDFMPFAPLILDVDAPKLLIGYEHGMNAAKLMTCTFTINETEHKTFQAIVHKDSTVRPQVVSMKDNPFIYSILVELQKISGRGVCINTSFNLHEFPIINDPKNAISVLNENKIDFLIFNNHLVVRDFE
jgi:carbamoyltransferase